jgi:DeoR family transcriptional regulator, fructose operon transcriptional repressor
VNRLVTSRQRIIIDILEANQLATVDELSKQLSVSEATVRRDLMALEAEGLINRTWGGAIPTLSVGLEQYVGERCKQNLVEKQAIAQAAVDLIEEGDVIALDVGTTCMEVAKLLKRFQRITVFTNSLLTAKTLSECLFTVHLIGGRMRQGEYSMVGNIARETILRFNYDKYFMGASGFDMENGPTDFNLDDVEIKQCFLKKARQRFALIDYSKFGKTSLATICEVEYLTDVITDVAIPADQVIHLKTKVPRVIVAK